MSNKISDVLKNGDKMVIFSFDQSAGTWIITYTEPSDNNPGVFSLQATQSGATFSGANFTAVELPQLEHNPEYEAQYALKLIGANGQYIGGYSDGKLISSDESAQFNILKTDDDVPTDLKLPGTPFVGILQFVFTDSQGAVHHVYPTLGTISGNTAVVQWSGWIGLGSGNGTFPKDTPPKQKWVFITGTKLAET